MSQVEESALVGFAVAPEIPNGLALRLQFGLLFDSRQPISQVVL
jgi:hypothetical protein